MCIRQKKSGVVVLGILLGLASAAWLSGCTEGSVCGNGVLERGETCDDGNDQNNDGCSYECNEEVGWSCFNGVCTTICGDGYVSGFEVCDPGDSPYCLSDCSAVNGSCGDGILQGSIEDCDPGPGTLRGCTAYCTDLFGFTCTDQPMECTASELPGDRAMSSLNNAELVQYCQWFIDTLGGTGNSFQCGDYIFTMLTAQECATNMDGINWGSCTVTEIEDWIAASGTQCGVMTSADPPCM